MSSFKRFKRAVLQINNDYWKKVQNNRNKSRKNNSPQYHTPKLFRSESRTLGGEERTSPNKKTSRFLSAIETSSTSFVYRNSISNILGADSQLIPIKQQCHMNLGLCLHCGQSGHLARACSRQLTRPTSSLGIINFIWTITPGILDQFQQSKWPPKALKKTFQMVPKTSQGNQYSLNYQQISWRSPSY